MKNVFVIILLSLVVVLIGCKTDSTTETENTSPEIQSVTANPSSIKVNETTTVTCVATDHDGDDLTYTWSAENGTLPVGSQSASTSWLATSGAGNFIIKVSVNDGKETVKDSTTISVINIPCEVNETVTYEGKTYNTVQIGNQCWLKENLNVGSKIHSSQDASNDGVIEKYCYDNLESNCDIYGGFYQWNEAMQYGLTEGSQGICPDGWHIPKYSEMKTLEDAIGNSSNALKAIGQGQDSGTGTNSSGFSALLSANRTKDGGFYSLNNNAYFWSSSLLNEKAYGMNLYYTNDEISYNIYEKNEVGNSIRCLKN